MFIVGQAGQDVNEYTLSTGFNVSTASFVDSFSVASQDTVPQGRLLIPMEPKCLLLVILDQT